jgi:hypothetical protein
MDQEVVFASVANYSDPVVHTSNSGAVNDSALLDAYSQAVVAPRRG